MKSIGKMQRVEGVEIQQELRSLEAELFRCSLFSEAEAALFHVVQYQAHNGVERHP